MVGFVVPFVLSEINAMSTFRIVAVVLCVCLCMLIWSPASAESEQAPFAWYAPPSEPGLCGSCFEVESLSFESDLGLPAVPTGDLDATNTLAGRYVGGIALAPGKSSSKGGAKKSYVPPEWAAGPPKTATWVTTGVLAAGWAALYFDDDVETAEEIGDYAVIALPAAGLGMSIGAKDKQGLIQYGISLGASTATIHLIKNTNDKYRPDASNTQSFPSGHTQAAFFGAGYIWQRYGAKWGIPAFVAAGFTGWSRVAGQKHFTDDVISGASIAMLYNWLIVKPADPERAAWQADTTRERKYRFEWEAVDATVSKNLVRAPSATGTELDFRFDENANPTMTSAISFDLKLNRHHSILFRYAPFEQRDVGTLDEDTIFGKIEFKAGDDVYSVYFQGDFRTRWAYELLPDSPFIVQLGGGLTYFDASVELYPIDLDEENPEPDFENGDKVRGKGIAPVLYAKLGGRPSKKTEIFVVGDGFSLDGESWLDVAAKFVYRFNSKWDVAAGWRSTSTEVEIEEIFNRFDAEGFLLHVGYSF